MLFQQDVCLKFICGNVGTPSFTWPKRRLSPVVTRVEVGMFFCSEPTNFVWDATQPVIEWKAPTNTSLGDRSGIISHKIFKCKLGIAELMGVDFAGGLQDLRTAHSCISPNRKCIVLSLVLYCEARAKSRRVTMQST